MGGPVHQSRPKTNLPTGGDFTGITGNRADYQNLKPNSRSEPIKKKDNIFLEGGTSHITSKNDYKAIDHPEHAKPVHPEDHIKLGSDKFDGLSTARGDFQYQPGSKAESIRAK